MAQTNWLDYLALILTLSFLGGIVYVFVNAKKAVSGAVESTKGSLKNRGLNVSANGLSVKTDKRFDREQYLDATQRGFIKAFNASSGGNQDRDAPPEATVGKKSSLRGRKILGRHSETLDK
ncbi:hypothetical protein C8Q80DRAFT_1274940 [Daedaleopsis nitida]|nr:hypothetical protein C8Q80DRAFT_1274940 [Daedaleopsis nitida]